MDPVTVSVEDAASPANVALLESGHPIHTPAGRAIKGSLPHALPYASIPVDGASMWHATARAALEAIQAYGRLPPRR